MSWWRSPVASGGQVRAVNVLASEAAEAGAVVLRARGSSREQGFAFGVALQLFEHYAANLDEGGWTRCSPVARGLRARC